MQRMPFIDLERISGVAPWVVAGALLLAASAPVTAQDATPAPVEQAAEDGGDDTSSNVGGGNAPSAVPATGAGPGLAGGGFGALAIGATAGAAVAAAAALRERLSKR
jgi:hypothetical protein